MGKSKAAKKSEGSAKKSKKSAAAEVVVAKAAPVVVKKADKASGKKKKGKEEVKVPETKSKKNDKKAKKAKKAAPPPPPSSSEDESSEEESEEEVRNLSTASCAAVSLKLHLVAFVSMINLRPRKPATTEDHTAPRRRRKSRETRNTALEMARRVTVGVGVPSCHTSRFESFRCAPAFLVFVERRAHPLKTFEVPPAPLKFVVLRP